MTPPSPPADDARQHRPVVTQYPGETAATAVPTAAVTDQFTTSAGDDERLTTGDEPTNVAINRRTETLTTSRPLTSTPLDHSAPAATAN